MSSIQAAKVLIFFESNGLIYKINIYITKKMF